MDQLATPAMVIDAKTVYRNIERLAAYADEHELDVRPHTKTHKSRQMAALQMAAGAVGLTAAKVGEAELMAEVADDMLLAYPAIDPARTAGWSIWRLTSRCGWPSIRMAAPSCWPMPPIGAAPRSASWSISTSAWDAPACKRRPRRSKLAQYVDATLGAASGRAVLLSGPHWRRRAAEQDGCAAGRLRQARPRR